MATGRGRRRPPPGRQARGAPAGRPGRRNGGYGSGGGNGGAGDNTPIIIALAGGGVVVVILLILLMSQGGGGTEPPPPVTTEPAGGGGGARPPADAPPKPLTDAEKERVREAVERLAKMEPDAVRLKNEGHQAHQAGDRERAQECWREARDILKVMIEESELMFEAMGNDRVEAYASRHYRITGKWPQILSEFVKYIE